MPPSSPLQGSKRHTVGIATIALTAMLLLYPLTSSWLYNPLSTSSQIVKDTNGKKIKGSTTDSPTESNSGKRPVVDIPKKNDKASGGKDFNPEAAPVAACLIVRDQPDDLLEWMMYHTMLGVSRFYVYDHGSDPPLERSLERFIESGLIEYTYYTFR